LQIVTRNVPVTVHPKEISISGVTATSKTYDASQAAEINMTGATISAGGVLTGDVVSIKKGIATFDSPNKGARLVTFSEFTLDGKDGENYRLSAQPSAITATISPRSAPLSIDPIPAQIYDGTQKTPDFIVKDYSLLNGFELKLGIDYNKSYGTNIEVGKNSGTVLVAGIGNFSGSGMATFEIKPAEAKLVIRQNDVAYGESPNPVVLENTSGGAVTYMYKLRDAADDTYSSTLPTKAGDYTVRGIAAATQHFAEAVGTDDFTINVMLVAFLDYAVVKWDNTLMLNKKKLEEDGFKVTACQWFKDGMLLPQGETFTWSKGPLESDKLESAEYSFILSTDSHGPVKSDTYYYAPVASNAAVIKAYPNPVVSGQKLTVESDETQEGYIEVYNAVGKLVQQVKPAGNMTTTTLNLPVGVYFIRANHQTIKLIIKK
jgi:hypothetical protein